MSAGDYELVDPPSDRERRRLWLQHAAGFILFENVRRYAIEQIDTTASAEARQSAEKAIDDCMYGLMRVIDGVPMNLRNSTYSVDVSMIVGLGRGRETIEEFDLRNGDGVCMGFHMWKEGDFGHDPVAIPKAN